MTMLINKTGSPLSSIDGCGEGEVVGKILGVGDAVGVGVGVGDAVGVGVGVGCCPGNDLPIS